MQEKAKYKSTSIAIKERGSPDAKIGVNLIKEKSGLQCHRVIYRQSSSPSPHVEAHLTSCQRDWPAVHRRAHWDKGVVATDRPEEVATIEDNGSAQLAAHLPVDWSARSVELAPPTVDRPVNRTSILSCYLLGSWIRFWSEFRSVGFLYFMDSLAI